MSKRITAPTDRVERSVFPFPILMLGSFVFYFHPSPFLPPPCGRQRGFSEKREIADFAPIFFLALSHLTATL